MSMMHILVFFYCRCTFVNKNHFSDRCEWVGKYIIITIDQRYNHFNTSLSLCIQYTYQKDECIFTIPHFSYHVRLWLVKAKKVNIKILTLQFYFLILKLKTHSYQIFKSIVKCHLSPELLYKIAQSQSPNDSRVQWTDSTKSIRRNKPFKMGITKCDFTG